MIWVVMFINLLPLVASAVRDAKSDRRGSWLEWHVWNWVALYGFEGIITGLCFWSGLIPITWQAGVIGILYTGVCWKLWRVAYEENR